MSYSLAPYEKRIIELLRNSKDKRARRLAKKRVRLPSAHGRTTRFDFPTRSIQYTTLRTYADIATARYLRPLKEKGRRDDQGHCRVEARGSLNGFMMCGGCSKHGETSDLLSDSVPGCSVSFFPKRAARHNDFGTSQSIPYIHKKDGTIIGVWQMDSDGS